MGKIVSRLIKREVINFNVETRAHRILDKDKPAVAPTYQSAKNDMQRALDVDPNIVEKLNKKNIDLDARLKQVYVTSQQPPSEFNELRQKNIDSKRPLPLERKGHDDFEFGYMEPRRVPPGRCTLRQALQFITANQSEPETWTKERIANDNKMKEQVVGNILHYFKSFSIYLPDEKFKFKELVQTPNTKQLKSTEKPTKDEQ